MCAGAKKPPKLPSQRPKPESILAPCPVAAPAAAPAGARRCTATALRVKARGAGAESARCGAQSAAYPAPRKPNAPRAGCWAVSAGIKLTPSPWRTASNSKAGLETRSGVCSTLAGMPGAAASNWLMAVSVVKPTKGRCARSAAWRVGRCSSGSSAHATSPMRSLSKGWVNSSAPAGWAAPTPKSTRPSCTRWAMPSALSSVNSTSIPGCCARNWAVPAATAQPIPTGRQQSGPCPCAKRPDRSGAAPLLQRFKRLAHILQKGLTRAGQPHGARGAVKQAHAHRLFKLANGFGQGRLRETQLTRRRCKSALARDLVKRAQLAQAADCSEKLA